MESVKPIKNALLILFSAIALSGCHPGKGDKTAASAADSAAAKDSAKSGWISLFDGKTTKGWHTYGKDSAGTAWKAENGVLHLDATKKGDWQTINGGDLVTNDEFENFDFKTDWKISRAGNSGIMFYVKEDIKKYPYCWSTGPESQICDNKENEDGKLVKHRAGELYELMSLSKDVVKPAGEWNTTEIVANNGKLDLYINNEHVINTTLWDANWKTLIAASKFKDMPDFGTFKKGKFGLQDHAADVWFKNIMIKKL